MNDSFGFLPQMQRAMERDAHSDDLAHEGDDYRDAQKFEVRS